MTEPLPPGKGHKPLRLQHDPLVNRYTLEWEHDGRMSFAYYPTEDEARKAQKLMSKDGFSSQIYHEHHVLIKQPVIWMGKKT